MDFKSITLSGLRHQLNPQQDSSIDTRELRAKSETGGLRVKTGKSVIFSSQSAREAHVRHAVAQVRMAAGNSIRERLGVGATTDISTHLEKVMAAAGDTRKSITLRQVQLIDEAVKQIDKKSAGPSAAALPQAWSGTPPRAPVDAEHSQLRERTPQDLPASTPFRIRPAASSHVTLHPASRAAASPEQVKICLTTLKTQHYSPVILSNLSAPELAQFHERLKALVEFAARVQPALVNPDKGYRSLKAAANYMLHDLALPADAALYRVVGGEAVFSALSPAGKQNIGGTG